MQKHVEHQESGRDYLWLGLSLLVETYPGADRAQE